MNQITALIIDDELNSREVLNTLISKYCLTVNVIGHATGADEGFELIKKMSPQLVFLDVKMPIKSGFDMLHMFDSIDFEIVFISAFHEFAVTAFDFNALAYVLKPIDYTKLIQAVEKASRKIDLQQKNNAVSEFIKTLEIGKTQIKKLSLHHNEKVIFVSISDIVSVESSTGICEIQLADGKHYYSTRNLQLFEDILKDAGDFIRITKSCILNLDFIKSYQKGEVCLLEMLDGREFEVSRRKKTEILNRLKSN